MLLNELEDLLLNISYKDEDEILGNNSFVKIYNEYSQYLTNVISYNLKGMGVFDEELSRVVLNNTFLTIYEKPLKFSVPEGAENDKCFKGWISRIARNELLSQIKLVAGRDKRFSDLDIQDDEVEFEEVEIDLYESANSKLLKDALNTLTERDREILLALYNYYEKDKKTPSEVLDELCILYSTTKPNIRQIKVRSEKKIVDYMTKYSQLKPLKNAK